MFLNGEKFIGHARDLEHARNLFKLSEALLQDDCDESSEEAKDLRDEAEMCLKGINTDVQEKDCGTESAYEDFIPADWR